MLTASRSCSVACRLQAAVRQPTSRSTRQFRVRTVMTSMQNKEAFPALEQIKQECDYLTKAKVGDPSTPFAATSAASADIEKRFNGAITFHKNASSLLAAMSAFFSRDNVGLAGIALYFKVLSQVEINDTWLYVDFLTKRGQKPSFGPVAGPPAEFQLSDRSDVLGAFVKALAVAKIQYKEAAESYDIAMKQGDAHAVDFLTNGIRAMSYKINMGSHYIAHLKVVEDNKLAIKEFDRRLPFEIEDLAAAAAVESTLSSRLMLGTVVRAQLNENKEFARLKTSDAASEMRGRAAWSNVI